IAMKIIKNDVKITESFCNQNNENETYLTTIAFTNYQNNSTSYNLSKNQFQIACNNRPNAQSSVILTDEIKDNENLTIDRTEVINSNNINNTNLNQLLKNN